MKKLCLAVLLCIGNLVLGQAIPPGYTQVGSLPANASSKNMDVLLSPDGKYFLLTYGFKPSTIEVYRPKGFEKLHTFSVKKAYFFNSSFDPKNNDIFYLTGSMRNYLKIDLKTGAQEVTKTRQLPDHIDRYNFWYHGQHAVTKRQGSMMYFLPEMYAVKFLQDEIQIYIWDEFLK